MKLRAVSLFVSWALAASGWTSAAKAQCTDLVSQSALGERGAFGGDVGVVSGDGRFVAFQSLSKNLVAVPLIPGPHVFVRDRVARTTVVVDVDSAGLPSDGTAESPAISANGRCVAFESGATTLASGEDPYFWRDIFIHDLATGETSLASVGWNGDFANASSSHASISDDGRFVAFSSFASNLVPGDVTTYSDVYVRDRETGSTILASVSSAGVQADRLSANPVISGDGRFVAFESPASNLVPSDTNNTFDVFVRDLLTGETTRVSVAIDGSEAASSSHLPSISADGRTVAFQTAAPLSDEDTNGRIDVYVHDRVLGFTRRASVDEAGGQFSTGSEEPSISGNGRRVAFMHLYQVRVFDARTGTSHVASVGFDGVEADPGAQSPSISRDGRYVAFVSFAPNLAPHAPGGPQTYVRDEAPCGAGTVDGGGSGAADVLRIDGSAGVPGRAISVAARVPVTISLDASPSGPSPARYAIWMWAGASSNQLDLSARGETLGCTANPTPLKRGAFPQPVRCLVGAGLPSALCRRTPAARGPSEAPFSLTRGRGFRGGFAATFQGLIEDSGAIGSLGFSVTNAVTLVVD